MDVAWTDGFLFLINLLDNLAFDLLFHTFHASSFGQSHNTYNIRLLRFPPLDHVPL